MKSVVLILVVLLVILHQDNWLWGNDTLVFGFLPIGLLFHAAISLAASITWYLATIYAWPADESSADSATADEGAAK